MLIKAPKIIKEQCGGNAQLERPSNKELIQNLLIELEIVVDELEKSINSLYGDEINIKSVNKKKYVKNFHLTI